MAISFGGGISIGGGITITAPSAAVVNGSATFNGSTQYLTLPNSSVPVNLSTGDFTAECWFVTTSASTAQTLFWLGGNTNAYATVRLAIDTSGLILYVSVDGASWAIISGVIGTVASNTWNHVAVTRSGSTFKVYLNGTQVGTNYTQAGTLYAGTLNYIGALNYSAIVSNPYRQLNGYISNARIVKDVVVYNPTGSVSFNGSSQYLTVPSSAAFTFGSGDFTVEAWIRPATVTGTKAIAGIFVSGTGGWYFGLNGNTLRLSSGFVDYDGATSMIANTWYHVAATKSSGFLRMYVNGVQVGTTTDVSGQNWTIQNTLYVGRLNGEASWYWNGYISNFRIVKGVAVYTANFNPGTNPLTSTQSANVNGNPSLAITGTSTSLLLNTPNTASFLTDSSTNNFTVTNVGTATSNALAPVASFATPTGPLTSTQSANQNGSPSAAITGTSTGVLLNTYYGASFLADASTNNLTVTNVASVTSSTLSPFTPATPGSVLFNGTNQVLTIPDNAVFEMSGDFTLEAWFYMTASPTDQGDIITKGASGNFQPYSVYVNASNAITLKSSSTGLAWDVANAVTFGTVTLNTWNHVAVSRSGTAMRLFLNGTLNATITNGLALYNNAFPVGIGARSDATELFTGYISNARIVKGVAVYTSAFTPSTVPLTSTQSANVNGTPSAAITGTSTSLLLNTVTGLEYLKDSSSNNFTVTNVGSATGNALDPF